VEELREHRQAQPVPLPALGDSLDENAHPTEAVLDLQEAATLANQLSERLTRNPDDIPARERLARVLAERLGKADLAIEQIKLLLGMPDAAENKRPEWLGLIAAWQLKFKHDNDTARQLMERLIAEYPHSPQALAARRRLAIMAAGQKLQQLRTARPTIRIVPDAVEPPAS
jgi:hypothetical protein